MYLIFQIKQSSQPSLENEEISLDESVSLSAPLSDSSDGALYSNVYTIAQETQSLSLLEKALLLWEQLVSVGLLWRRKKEEPDERSDEGYWTENSKEEADNLLLMASIFKLADKVSTAFYLVFLQSSIK